MPDLIRHPDGFDMKNALFHIALFLCPAVASAGIVGDIGDIGVRLALINIWKGLGGLALFIAGAYMIANKRPFRYKSVAFAASLLLVTMTITGIFLFLIEFWPVISAVISRIAALFE